MLCGGAERESKQSWYNLLVSCYKAAGNKNNCCNGRQGIGFLKIFSNPHLPFVIAKPLALTQIIPMMKTIHQITSLAMAGLLFASCQNGNKTENETGVSDTTQTTETPTGTVTLTDVSESPKFSDAKLSIANVTAAAAGDSSKVSFAFDVKNYDLKAQTEDAANKMCNNSAQGQHIHFILDNKPYTALYEPKHEVSVAKNSEHYLLAFLSRSYHESIKEKDAAVLYHFKIDEAGKLVKLEEPKEPILFYSRPKGDYMGKDTANLLLDFYVWNGKLGNDLKVKADISNEANGRTTSTTFTDWKPQFIQGLGTGTAKVTLTLQDKDGNTVAGPQSTVTRENIRLAASEPMK